MTRIQTRWITIACASLGLLVGSLTAAAKPTSIKGAAAAAWTRDARGDVTRSHYRYQGYNGQVRATVQRSPAPRVVVTSKTPMGRKRVTTFSIHPTTAGPPSLVQDSTRLVGEARRAATRPADSARRGGSGDRYYTGGHYYTGGSANAGLEAARGHAPGTVGHYNAVRRAGYYPDSIGVRQQSGYPTGSIGDRNYWSNPSAPSGHSSGGLRSFGW